LEELVNDIKKIHGIVGEKNVLKHEFKPNKIIFETNTLTEEHMRKLRLLATNVYLKKFPNFYRIEYVVRPQQLIGLLKHAVEKARK